MHSWRLQRKQPLRYNHLQLFPCPRQEEKLQQEDQDHQAEEEDTASQTHSITLLGPLEEGIQVAAGEILEEEEVTREEQEGEVEIRFPRVTNSWGINPRSSRETGGSRSPSCKNGTYIGASIDSPHK